jgi:hypothetical protein
MLALLVVASLQPTVPSAPGDGAPVLRWTAPEGCPNQANVEARITDYLGAMPPPGSAAIDASVVATDDGRLRLTVKVTSGSGATDHALASDRCEVLADAVALIAAVALDPLEVAAAVEAGRTTPLPEPEPAPPPEDLDDPVPEPDAAPPPAPTENADASLAEPNPGIRRFPRLRLGLRPEFIVDWGALPGVAVGGAFSGALLGQHWRFEAGPVFVAGRSASSSLVSDATALISLTAVDVRGCGVLRSRNRVVEGPLCGGIELGALRGRGTGSTVGPEDRTRLWSAAILAPAVAFVPRYWLSIFVGADVIIPLSRTAFEIGDEEVHRAQSAGVRGRLGVEVRVP